MVTTTKSLTAGAPKTPTAGVFVFAGDHLAGGKLLSPALSCSPAVTPTYRWHLLQFASGICYRRHLAYSPGVTLCIAGTYVLARGNTKKSPGVIIT
jgi:uncharacterized metal-binding protein